jgi:transposase-like protein
VSETKIAVPFATSSSDPEVAAKPERRKFSAEEKKRILEETDRAVGNGGVGAILRREGIYSSTLHGWRKERDAAAVRKAFSQKRVRRRSAIRWPGKTKSCGARISAYKKSWRKLTSSSTFKKKWLGCWVVRFRRFRATGGERAGTCRCTRTRG